MREPKYGEALLHAVKLVWQQKYLWFLGVLSLFLGQWGLADFVGQINVFANEGFTWPNTVSDTLNAFIQMEMSGWQAVLLTMWVLTIVVLIVVAVAIIAAISRAAIIVASDKWFENGKHISLTSAWRTGVDHFGKILAVNILGKLLQLGLAILAGWSYFTFDIMTGSGLLAIVVCSAVCILLAMLLEAVTIFSSGHIVIENRSFGRAIILGWNQFRQHILLSLEMALILMLLTLAAGLAAVSAGIVVIGSVTVLLWLISLAAGWMPLMTFGFALSGILFIIWSAIAGGIINSFNTASWIYLFSATRRESHLSRLFGWVRRLWSR